MEKHLEVKPRVYLCDDCSKLPAHHHELSPLEGYFCCKCANCFYPAECAIDHAIDKENVCISSED